MITAVYFSSKNIQVIQGKSTRGKANVTRVYDVVVPEECLINGVITDEAMLRDSLSEFWKSNRLPAKKVTLVVNSSQIVVKPVELPKLKPRGLRDMIKNEFTDVERQTDPVYGYCVLVQTASSVRLLATMAESSFVESYLRLFKDIGVEVSTMLPAVESAVRFLEQIPLLRRQTCIIQLIDDNNLNNILWMDGRYEYTSRTRLFSERGTGGFWDEVGRTVNNLQQFYSSLKREEPLREIYVGGMADEGLEMYADNMYNLGLTVNPLEAKGAAVLKAKEIDRVMGDYAFLLGSFFPSKKDWNLLGVYKKSYKAKEKRRKFWKHFTPVAIILLFMALIAAGLMKYTEILQKQADELNAWLTDPENIEQSVRGEAIKSEIVEIGAKTRLLENLKQVMDSYPRVDSTIENAVIRAGSGIASVRIQSYDGNNGTLKLEATAVRAEDVNRFIANLYELQLFSGVEYSGYTYDEARQVYRINVTCYMNTVNEGQEEGSSHEN